MTRQADLLGDLDAITLARDIQDQFVSRHQVFGAEFHRAVAEAFIIQSEAFQVIEVRGDDANRLAVREFFQNRHFATVRDGLAIFQDDSLLFPPGTRFSYSSYGWNLVSAVVEGAAGEEFLPYISAHVFRPLGLTHTAPDRSDSLIPDRTQFYDADSSGASHVAPPVDNSYKWAGGGFVSTAEDLVKFGSALMAPGFLRRETLDLLFTSQRTSAGEETGYGIGWFVRTDSLGHHWVFHGGSAVGGTAVLGLDRDAHLVMALLTNLSDAPVEPAQEIETAFEGLRR
jgi:CubicO group peptidase (beta-lactamase class C family)